MNYAYRNEYEIEGMKVVIESAVRKSRSQHREINGKFSFSITSCDDAGKTIMLTAGYADEATLKIYHKLLSFLAESSATMEARTEE